MNVLIDQTEVEPNVIAPPAMNYGQHEQWDGFARRRFEYVIPVSEFVLLAKAWWATACSELKADIPFRVRGEDAAVDKLENLGYPPIEDMVTQYPADLAAFLQWDDLGLLNLVEPTSHSAVRFCANSVDTVSVSGDEVRFAGVAYEYKTTPRGRGFSANQ